MRKLRVGVVFGGKSGEHEVSVRSAESIRNNLDKEKYEVVDIFVEKDGSFDIEKVKSVDVVFPIIHGTYGEDGCLQGMLEMLDLGYVGPGVLGSAVGMDKDVQKRLLSQSGIAVAKHRVGEIGDLKYPVYVKTANMGSSVGVYKVSSIKYLVSSIKKAFEYDTKVIIEEEVKGREIEVSVLGNDDPVASLPGEIIPVGHEFYDYDAKYLDENGARLEIPAKLQSDKVAEVQRVAIKVFKTLECSGMARVDMF